MLTATGRGRYIELLELLPRVMRHPGGSRSWTDSNLLFGVLCLQAELIDATQFAAACGVWAARRDGPLAALVVERGRITPDDRGHVEIAVV